MRDAIGSYARITHREKMMTEPAAPDIHSLVQLLEDTITQHQREPQRIAGCIRECRQIGIDVLPFDVNRSEVVCVIEDEQAIRVGFSLLSSARGSFVKALLAERRSSGYFSSFQNFCERLDIEKIPDEFLAHAIQIGGFDSIEASRTALFQGYRAIIQAVQEAKIEQATGQFSLFAQPAAGTSAPIRLPNVDEWTKETRIAQEEDVLGFSFEECLLDIEAEEDVSESPEENDTVTETAETTSSIESQPSTEIDVPIASITDSQPDTISDEALSPLTYPDVELSSIIPETLGTEPLLPPHAVPQEEESILPPEVTGEEAVSATTSVSESGVVIREGSEVSRHTVYSAIHEMPSEKEEEPPLPPFEFTADEYDVSFPDGIPSQPSGGVFYDPEEDSEEIVEADPYESGDHTGLELQTDNPHAPHLVIQLSTLVTTERMLTTLKHILQQHPGDIPVVLQCIDAQNQNTRISIPPEYATDASEDCRAAIAALTGYHAIKFSA